MPPPPTPIPHSVTTWSVKPGGGEPLTYGDVHEMMHRDIAMGNDYRKERIKHLATLATGIFALTATFHKDLIGQTPAKPELFLMLAGWLLLVVSLLAGIVHFRKWEDFYLGFRDTQNALWRYHAGDAAEQAEAPETWRKANETIQGHQKGYRRWDDVQTGCLIAGMILIIASIAASVLL